jgi:hypothetical protein
MPQPEIVTHGTPSNIDYKLLAQHITEQQKTSENELAVATVNQSGEASVSHTLNFELAHSNEILNPSANPVATDGTPQASEVVPASALGALLDVFTVKPAGSNVDSNLHLQLTDCVPLGATVSSQITLKICNNEFVDLKFLLPNSHEKPLSIM